MNQPNIPMTSKAIVRTFLSAAVFLFWLFSLSNSVAHAQEHAVIDDHNCHVCLLTEDSNAKANHNKITLPFFPQAHTRFIVKKSFVLCSTCLFLSDSDPPKKS